MFKFRIIYIQLKVKKKKLLLLKYALDYDKAHQIF